MELRLHSFPPMHYHPIPQMPGDFWILCPDHVGPDLDMTYLCDCPNNACYQCEEEALEPQPLGNLSVEQDCHE